MSLSGSLIVLISESTLLTSTDSELSDLLTRGSDLFNQLDQQLETLQKQLDNSETTIILFRENLNQVSERMQASKEWLAVAYADIDLLEKQNVDLKINNEKLRVQAKRRALFGFGFGGVSFGIGMPLLIEEVRTDNQTMMWAGVGTLLGSGGI
jgi:septal ring factor EnvC (AmiA/AmiB activator)